MVTWQFCERRKSCVPEIFSWRFLSSFIVFFIMFSMSLKKKNQKKSKKSEVKKKNEKWDVGVGVKWMGRVGKKNEKIFTFFHFNFFFKFVNISWQDDFFFFFQFDICLLRFIHLYKFMLQLRQFPPWACPSWGDPWSSSFLAESGSDHFHICWQYQ